MDQSLFKFDLIAEDPTTHARAGVLHTPHGDIETPIFMPVGTKANVKGIPTETVMQLGAQIVLANTYHLSMRPGEDTIAELGGLHKFMNWHGPILTDSGGFQVFSHNDAVKLTDEGVRFIVNDYDGRHVFWTPEDNMEIAMKLGSDICMQLDQCPGYPATPMNTRPEMVHQTREFESQTPMQRMAKVEEMAGPALFLASDAASFCTGVDLVVDGGFVCW